MKQVASGIAAAVPASHASNAILQRWVIAGAAIALWAAVPALVSRSIVDMLVFSGLYTIAGLGVTFLLGQCGIVSLAQSVFYGIGAYSTAYFCLRKGLPSQVGISAGVLMSGSIAALV